MKKIIEFLGFEKSNFTMKNNLQTLAIILLLMTAGSGNVFTAILLLASGITLAHFSGLFEPYNESGD